MKRKKYVIDNGQNNEQYTFSNDVKKTFLVTFLKRVFMFSCLLGDVQMYFERPVDSM